MKNINSNTKLANIVLAEEISTKILVLLEQHYLEREDIDYIEVGSSNTNLQHTLAKLKSLEPYMDTLQNRINQKANLVTITVRSKAGEIYTA